LKVQNLPPIEILNLGDLKEDRKAIIFTDKIVWEKIAPHACFKQKDIIYVERPTETYLSSLVNSLGNYEVVYGIGGGVANDVAKFIGFYKKVETVSIPTIFFNRRLFNQLSWCKS